MNPEFNGFMSEDEEKKAIDEIESKSIAHLTKENPTLVKKDQQLPFEKSQDLNTPEIASDFRKNKRVQMIQEQISELNNKLAETIKDLQEREITDEFKKAQEFYAQGYRIKGWGQMLTDTNNETILYNNKDNKYEEIGYWADGVNRDTDEAFEILGLNSEENNENILKHLNNITLEK